jgi:hypothetical protein
MRLQKLSDRVEEQGSYSKHFLKCKLRGEMSRRI